MSGAHHMARGQSRAQGRLVFSSRRRVLSLFVEDRRWCVVPKEIISGISNFIITTWKDTRIERDVWSA